MGNAYTPGLKISPRTTIDKVRRLPLKGKVLVNVGDHVTPRTVVAKTELPGIMQTIKLAERMGLEPSELKEILLVKAGDQIEKGTILARTKGLFGMFKSEEKSMVAGNLEFVSEVTGHLGIRQPAIPIEKDAYITGTIKQVIEGEGVVVECKGAVVQGIFGVGGERQGDILVIANSGSESLSEKELSENCRGKIIVGGSNISLPALRKAAEVGALGIIVGGIVDRDLIDYLRESLSDPNFDIGVAITGHENIPFTLVITEGFGTIPMAERTFQLLKSLDGKTGSINGATQIRAGVIRPELIVPIEFDSPENSESSTDENDLETGTAIRVIREPYFGLLGEVTELPAELEQVDSETWVRVLRAKLSDGRVVTVPRANVEILQS